MKNPVQWFEIATTDLERAKNFYATVFDLEFQFIEMPDSKMYMFGVPDGIGSSGCLLHSSETKPSTDGSTIYFSCEDVAVQAGRVEEAGGKVLFPKTDIGEFGFFSHIIDSEGNRIGLHSNK
jgi:predicted enzyme related to lactoylglutathione lyase